MGYYLNKGQAAKNLLILSYKRTAKTKGLKFCLKTDEFFIITKQNCTYCGCLPNKKVSSSWKNRKINGDYIYNGLDRLDNNKGYILSNVVPCCSLCNYLKRNLTVKQFKAHIKKIYKNLMEK